MQRLTCYHVLCCIHKLLIFAAGFSVPTDNVIMQKVVGLNSNGRIFMCGKDGNLYEFHYQAQDNWLWGKKCRKINHTTSVVSSLIPSFLKFTQEDPIVDVVVDQERSILYTLSERSNYIQGTAYHIFLTIFSI